MSLIKLSDVMSDVQSAAGKLDKVIKSRKLILRPTSKRVLLDCIDELEETANGYIYRSSSSRSASCTNVEIAKALIASKLAVELKKYRDVVYDLLKHLGQSKTSEAQGFFKDAEKNGTLDQNSKQYLINQFSVEECDMIEDFLCNTEKWGKGKGLERLQDYRKFPNS